MVIEYDLGLNKETLVCDIEGFKDALGKHNNQISIFNMNIRSINKNFDEFLVFVQSLMIKFDVVVLTETWNIQYEIDKYKIPGYNMHYNNGTFNQNDGVVVYVREGIQQTVQLIKTDSGTTFLRLHCVIKNAYYGITAIYRSPSGNVREFLRDLERKLPDFINCRYPVEVIVGDINIDILEPDAIANNYLDIMSEYGFVTYLNKPTRVTSTSKSCVDHIFIKHENTFFDDLLPVVIESFITDHYSTSVLFKEQLNTPPVSNNNNYNYVKTKFTINYKKLNNQLRNEKWNDVCNCRDVNTAASLLLQKIKTYILESQTIVRTKAKYRKIKPWMTNGILNSIRHRDRISKEVLKDPFNLQLINYYKKYRNKLTNLIKTTKDIYYKSKLDEVSGNLKKTWQIINEITNYSKKTSEIGTIVDDKNNNIDNDTDKANHFNKFFQNVGTDMAKLIDRKDNHIFSDTYNPNTIYLLPTTESEIDKYIRNLKNTNSSGNDGITNIIIKEIGRFILKPLVFITNLCFQTGTFPLAFKNSLILPIFKSGEKTVVNNYRPISLTSNLGKIIEKCIKVRLTNFFDKFKILADNQYGFRTNVSTNDAIYAITSKIHTSLDKNKKTLAVFLDLAKAFDTVCHISLCRKLENLGIRGKAIELINSYLSERTQKVTVNGTSSNELIVKLGIPQGTVLGPLLFSIYINDLTKSNVNGEIISFADDTAIVFTADSNEELVNKAEDGMARIIHKLKNDLLSLNLSKTKFVYFSLTQQTTPPIPSIFIHSLKCTKNNKSNCRCTQTITPVDHIKYLGICIDSNMRWKKHLEETINKIRKALYKFKLLKAILKRETIVNVYYALVQSVIQYGIIGWGGVANCYLVPLEILQKLVLKIIFNKDYSYSTELLFIESNIFSIRQIYMYSLALFAYKHQKLLTISTHPYPTRSKEKHLVINSKTFKSASQKHASYLCTKLFNEIPIDLRNIPSLNIFKLKIKKWIKSKPLDYYAYLSTSLQ